MCRHIYNWNIIKFDVKQPIKQPTSLIFTSSELQNQSAIISRSIQMIKINPQEKA